MSQRRAATPADTFNFIVLTPAGTPAPQLAVAACRAGALGVLDLEFAGARAEASLAAVREVEAAQAGPYGVLVGDDPQLLDAIWETASTALETVLLAVDRDVHLASLVDAVHAHGRRAVAVVTGVEQAAAAQSSGADAVVAKGQEAGGWVGEQGSYVLLQRCLQELELPVFAHGGVGLHTAAACALAGAAGAVLDAQVLLARESPLPDAVRERLAAMDGSEAIALGTPLGAPVRVLLRPDLDGALALRARAEQLEADGPEDAHQAWRDAVAERVDWTAAPEAVLAVGQDGCFAADLARRFATVGGIVSGLRGAVNRQLALAAATNPLSAEEGLAASHGTTYPIVQGPMTRVSDRAEFAADVAAGGGLPFLALALLRGGEVRDLLARTQELLGDRPWGVGILGFVPAELRAEQLAAVREVKPPFALIAGGRPDQARVLEEDGTATYLHVPSPGLLRLYLKDGARRFVFEGRECGGHVGPRTSFVLWDTMVRGLLQELGPGDHDDVHVLFAGGIHDARSAAMVAAITAPLTERGVRVGVLMGTAYLFTEEAVSSGAITATYQEASLAGRRTVLLESGPGHATRCLPSPFVDEFAAERRRLLAEGCPPGEFRDRLEELNIGRLRTASKGTQRHPRYGVDPDAPKLVDVEPGDQWQHGMYMIGEVAAMHDRVTPIAELHAGVIDGCAALLDELPADVRVTGEPAPPPADIAIIGVGTILPGAPDAATFWSNILEKVDAVGEIPPERWDWRAYFDDDRATPDRIYSRWGGFVDDVEFDPMAFGMPPNTLRSIEPFQLLGLMAAKAALTDAGYGEGREWDRERASVMFGAGGGGGDLAVGYTVRSALPALLGSDGERLIGALDERLPEWTEDSFAGLLMNVAAGRIANRLDFGGTNFTVDAACGSSLAAITLGVRDLQAHNSDLTIVGGVDAIQNPFAYLCFSKTQALSPTGRCRPFDAGADGIAISEGFAAVVLKRLADAERDGDRVYAVIRGVGSASDGRDRSLTAPRPEGQMRALRRAYAHAHVSPADVGLVEAHGTGTVAGDRAEIEALRKVFDEHGAGRQETAVGSVKSMIGHTKATAGVAGVVKTALALHHRVLPPTLHVETPNPRADFANSPFYPNVEARPWVQPDGGAPRRAGVSAFGFGGTNFHIVLEEYAGDVVGGDALGLDRWPCELLLWRADTGEALAETLTAFAQRLDAQGPDRRPSLADLALSVAAAADERAGDATATAAASIVATSVDDLRAKLDRALAALRDGDERLHTPDGVHVSTRPLAADGGLALLFPGQGSQVVGMGRAVGVVFPEARAAFDRADAVLAFLHDEALSRYVFPPPAFTEDDEARQRERLTDTHVAQPALGATELAYLAVLAGLGVEGDLAAGHSYGELVALHAAGVLDADDLLRLSEARGRFMREGAGDEPGAMAAVDCGPDALRELVDGDDELVFANLNGPQQTVVSGTTAAVQRAVTWCTEHDLRARPLPVACAFHSPLVAPARDRFAEAIDATPFRTPSIPVFSNTTAACHAEHPEALTATLAEHLASPVRFTEEIEAMHEAGGRVFLEVGPRSVLTGLTGRILGDREHVAVAVSPSGRTGLDGLLHALATIAAEGAAVRTDRLFRGRTARRLDPRTLAPPGGHPPKPRSLWLVNGGSARPATQPLTPKTPLQLDEVTMSSTNGHHANGHHPDPVPEPAPPPAAVPAQAPPPLTPAPPIAGGIPGDVMDGHHHLMQHFLATQRDVMLAYLGGGTRLNGGAASAPAPLRAAPERRAALPQPAAAASPPPSAAAPAAPPPPSAVPAAPIQEAAPPAPPTPAPAPAPAAAAANGSAAGFDIKARLLEIVSDRTGYPADMLDLDADLESDLGVDSIKRVEIAGTLTQEMTLPDGVEPDVEQLTASRTLRAVIEVLEDLIGGGAGGGSPAPDEPVAAGAQDGGPSPFDEEPAGGRIGRFTLQTAGAPAVTEHATLAQEGVVAIVDDGRGTGTEVAALLAAAGHRAVLVDALAEDAVEPVLADLREHGGRVKALVHLAALGDPAGELLTPLLLLAQGVREDLEAAAADGGAAVLAATSMGGTFGLEADAAASDLEPRQAVLTGFVKSLAHEWEGVRVTALDLDAEAAEPARAARHVTDELLAADGLVEVGHRDGRRMTVTLAEADALRREPVLELGAEAVVLVTGGARGITAATALELARRHRPTLVLAGRTALPDGDEDPATAAIDDPRELQRVIIDRLRAAGEQPTPKAVGAEVRRLLAVREVRATLRDLRDAGATAEYRSCDVADPEALTALVDDVVAVHGRLDGVIHGAGVIEDKLIRDKTPDSLRRVLATKSEAALTLAECLPGNGLSFLCFFSSVSGRFGNRGQADYAAASEVLNKLAQRLDRAWPETRVVSVNWGPWGTTGMVTPEIERQFAQRGVALIPLDVGARRLEEELRLGRKGEVEVLIGGGDALPWDDATAAPAASATPSPPPAAAILGVATTVTAGGDAHAEVTRRLAVTHDRFLDDHRLDAVPVLPFAGSLELMAATAQAARPGLHVTALRDVRLHQGVTLDEEERALRLLAAPAADGAVDVALTAGGAERPNYQATVELATALDGAPADAPAPLDGLAPFPLTVADAYRDLLFHGPLFQGVEAIDGIGPQGTIARLRASAPTDCLAGVDPDARWILDPVLIDCALQMQVLWARVQWDITPLPASLVVLRRHAPAPAPGEPVRHELRLHPTSRPPMCTADHHLYAADGTLIATLTGMLGVGSRSLNRLARTVTA